VFLARGRVSVPYRADNQDYDNGDCHKEQGDDATDEIAIRSLDRIERIIREKIPPQQGEQVHLDDTIQSPLARPGRVHAEANALSIADLGGTCAAEHIGRAPMTQRR
jgi:hypothetical protein